MPWVRLDEGFPNHPKVASICAAKRPLAAWLHINALCWSNTFLTDGRIPAEMVNRLGADVESVDVNETAAGIADLLVSVGMWERDGNGFIIHDFHDYQPSRREVEARRKHVSKERSKAGSKGGSKTASKRAANGQQRPKQMGSPVPGTPGTASKNEAVPAGAPLVQQLEGMWRAAAKSAGTDLRLTLSHPEFDALEQIAQAYTADEFELAAKRFWGSGRKNRSLLVFRQSIADDLAHAKADGYETQAQILTHPTVWSCPACGDIHETPRSDYLAKRCPNKLAVSA